MNTPLRAACSVLLILQAATPLPSQQQQSQQPPSTVSAQGNLVAACPQPCLEDGTPVRLRMSQTVSSADAHVDDRVEFEVLQDIKVADVLVIPKGGIAWGTVTEAQAKRRMARGGKLEIVMDSVRLTDGEKAALRATKEGKGGGHTGAMTAGIVATGLIFFPAAPFFLFMHGKDITFPKGSEVPTFIDGNFHLDLSKFQQSEAIAVTAPAPTQATGAQSPTATEASISLDSTPVGAEVDVDGAFVGNTPSTVGISPGDHTITIAKKGYKSWERKVKVTTGKIEISAELEPEDASQPKP